MTLCDILSFDDLKKGCDLSVNAVDLDCVPAHSKYLEVSSDVNKHILKV